MDEAQDILSNLHNGADFSWLAKERSVDSAALEGGDTGWLTKAEMPEPVSKILDTLKPGVISPIIKIDSLYRIIRLLGRREEEVQMFDKVKNAVYRASFEEQLNTLLNKYVTQLKTDAEIKINDDTVRLLEKKYQK
jgi:parvulin-like peptidyl-prolyl isomerase